MVLAVPKLPAEQYPTEQVVLLLGPGEEERDMALGMDMAY